MQIEMTFALAWKLQLSLGSRTITIADSPPFKAIRRDPRFLCGDLLAQPCDDKCSKQRKSVKLPKYYSAVSPAPVLEFTTSMFKRPHLSKVPTRLWRMVVCFYYSHSFLLSFPQCKSYTRTVNFASAWTTRKEFYFIFLNRSARALFCNAPNHFSTITDDEISWQRITFQLNTRTFR